MGSVGTLAVISADHQKAISEAVNYGSCVEAASFYGNVDFARYDFSAEETPPPEVDWFELNRSFAQGDE